MKRRKIVNFLYSDLLLLINVCRLLFQHSHFVRHFGILHITTAHHLSEEDEVRPSVADSMAPLPPAVECRRHLVPFLPSTTTPQCSFHPVLIVMVHRRFFLLRGLHRRGLVLEAEVDLVPGEVILMVVVEVDSFLEEEGGLILISMEVEGELEGLKIAAEEECLVICRWRVVLHPRDMKETVGEV